LADVVRLVGTALPYVPALIALLCGIWAARRMLSPDIRARPDRGAAIWLASVIAVVAGVLITIAVASIAVMFSSNPPNYAFGLPFGIGIGALLGLAGILGYSILARPGFGRIALAGTLIGPAILVGATALATSVGITIGQAQLDNEQARHAEEVAARSAKVHLTVEDLEVDTARGGAVVAAVRMRVRLSTDVAVSFDPALKEQEPRFLLSPADPQGAPLEGAAPADSPVTIDAGQSHVYELAFEYSSEMVNGTQGGTYRAGSPGTWTMEVFFNDPMAGEYDVKLPVEVR
jgi:hypothetical protein